MKLDFKFTAKQVVEENKTTLRDIQKIKIWLFTPTEKFVPTIIPDELIVLFLLSCDNDIELTKKTIIAYYKVRKSSPDMFDQRKMDRADLQLALNTMRMVSIPTRTDDDDSVMYLSLRDASPSNFELLPVMKATFMVMELHQIQYPQSGLIYIVDMEGFSLTHVTKLRPDPLNKYFTYLGDGLPMKFKAMHFLNANAFLDKLLSIVGMFLHPEVMKRLHMHQPGITIDELTQIVPKKCLPQELGGDLGSQDELAKQTIEALKEAEKFWDSEEKLRKENL